MEWVRSWLTGLTCAALLAALAEQLMPKGAVRQVGRLSCGALLICAALGPSARLDPEGLLDQVRGLGEQTQLQQQELEQQNRSILKNIIEQEAAAYIVDKAAQLGVTCRAEVMCAVQDDRTWSLWSVRVEGELTAEQHRQLSALVEEELDIPLCRQEYTGGEGP